MCEQGFQFWNCIFAWEDQNFGNFVAEIIWNFDLFWMNLNKSWPNSQKIAKRENFRGDVLMPVGGEITKISNPGTYLISNLELCSLASWALYIVCVGGPLFSGWSAVLQGNKRGGKKIPIRGEWFSNLSVWCVWHQKQVYRHLILTRFADVSTLIWCSPMCSPICAILYK